MTVIAFLVVAVGLWRLGVSGVLRWAGMFGAALGLCVVVGIAVDQGLPLLVAASFVWLIGRGLEAPPARAHRL